MKNAFVLAAVAMAVLSTGCTRSSVDRWVKSDGTENDLAVVRSQCQSRTEQPSGNYGDLVTEARKTEAYETCLRGQGYWNDAKRMKR